MDQSMQAIDNYNLDKARLQDFLPAAALEDPALVKRAYTTWLTTRCLEFEFKCARHLLRGRTKKKMVQERISEFSVNSMINNRTHDWKMEVCPELVKVIEACIAGPGP